jgi:chromosome segregation ATPase
MFVDLSLNLIAYTVGAFVLGWILSTISTRMTNRQKEQKSNPHDHRIRSLEADHRVAQTESEKAKEKSGKLEDELKQTTVDLGKRDEIISHQQKQIDKFKCDLKVSVRKTRELRSELTDRASENIKSEVKLREVETELEIAQVSADMLATGVLDYSQTEDVADGAVEVEVEVEAKVEAKVEVEIDEDVDDDGEDADDSILGKAITDF